MSDEDKDEKEWDTTAAYARALDHAVSSAGVAESRSLFPEVRGLCRTCEYALIRRRELSDVPSVICASEMVYQNPHRVPLDIMECSGYRRNGEMHLRDMHRLGIVLDVREDGGQYL